MTNIFRWLKERRLQMISVEDERIRNGLAEINIRIKKYLAAETDKMLATYCPINKGKCSKECMHFHAGYAQAWHRSASSKYFPEFNSSYSSPSCKLWREF